MNRAACKGLAPNLRENPAAKDPFFPGKGQSATEAQIICMTKCPVRDECEEFRARTQSKHGVWAGKLQKRGE